MQSRVIRASVTALAICSACALPAAASAAVPSSTAYALDGAGAIHTFTLSAPGSTTAKPLSGLPAGSSVLGIDERPKTGQLYALVRGSAGALSAYVVDPASGAATLEFALVDTTGAPVLANGQGFGVDFNPVADALRITSDAGQNLRALPSDRVVAGVSRPKGTTFTDGTLSYDPITAPMRTTATGINASAYTQNLMAPTATTLFNIDTARSALTKQLPPNDGTQVKVGDVALNGRPVQGLDITTTGTGDDVTVAALANEVVTLPPANIVEQLLQRLGLQKPATTRRTALVEVDESTGALSKVGTFGRNDIVDIAVDTPGPVG